MSTQILIRWSGLVSLLAGVLFALAALIHPVGENLAAVSASTWVPSHLIYWVSTILMQFGLVGFYARQAEKTGWLGLISFILAFIGTSMFGSVLFMNSTTIPLIAANAPAIFDQAITPPFSLPIVLLGFVLGYLLFGIATMRANVLPRWAGLLLIIGVLLFVIAAPFEPALSHLLITVSNVVLGVSLAWMGYALWSEKREPTLPTRHAG